MLKKRNQKPWKFSWKFFWGILLFCTVVLAILSRVISSVKTNAVADREHGKSLPPNLLRASTTSQHRAASVTPVTSTPLKFVPGPKAQQNSKRYH